MKLSIHVDLSLCDEARQVWDWVGDICKEMHWSSVDTAHISTQSGPRGFYSFHGSDGVCGGEEKTVNSLMDEQSYCTSMQKTFKHPSGKGGQ